jgi:hypothetical protein
MKPRGRQIPVVFHKRNRNGTIVAMKEEDFWRIEKMLTDMGYDLKGF